MTDFVRQFRDRREEGVRTGVVRAVSTADGLDVEIGGGLVTGLQFLDSYSAPGVGDVVAVLPMPGRMFVLGKYGTSGGNLGPNLLPNPGFEFGVAGNPPSSWSGFWSGPTGGVLWMDDETLSHSSGSSAQLDTGSLTVGQFRRNGMIDSIAVKPGVTYRLAAWFKSVVTDPNVTIRVNIHTAAEPVDAQPLGTGVISTNVVSSTPTSSWVELSGTHTIPVDHFYARVYLVSTASGSPSTPYVYVDDVSMREQI